ncbi:MAG: hypothetical protein DMG30_01920 [Acidobacteria bacterium]|nr:MAG: hypothetical protein DMG30_01920 [Acidobacteriota bacterium]PYY03263.1 MAG: hypothetical protein DMG69_32830 [Acidobacteriota bacterium]
MLRRLIQALKPFGYIGKEIERRPQEGEDISLLEISGPIRYQPGQTGKTHAADARLILRAKQFPFQRLMRTANVSQHALERFPTRRIWRILNASFKAFVMPASTQTS